MTARTIRLERRLPPPDGTGKWCFVCDLHTLAAARHESVRDRMSLVEPGWTYRAVDQATGEVTHLDAQGNPVGPEDAAIDCGFLSLPWEVQEEANQHAATGARRVTHAEEMADLAAERYERDLDRRGGECL